MDTAELKRNIETVLSRIDAASRRRAEITGSMPRVRIVAASKMQSTELLNKAVECGLTSLGENRVQELMQKRELVTGAEWHFIGTLQRNKVKRLVGRVSLIQSIASEETALEVQRVAEMRGEVQDVLVEVNIGGEASKTGLAPEKLDALITRIGGLSALRLRGLMTVMPIGAESGLYDDMYRVFGRYAGGNVDTLSMGMSGDFERAVEHGSNMVRIGTGFFGQRAKGV